MTRSRALALTAVGAVLATLSFAPPYPEAAAIDGVVYNPATGHYYKAYDSAVSLATAEAQAQTDGGYLVSITSQAENSWVVSNMSGGQSRWIGLTDRATEGVWVWLSGEAFGFTNWNSGEPNNSNNEDGVELYTNGNWNDLPVTFTRRFIVEWDSDPNGPPPAPAGLTATAEDDRLVNLSWSDTDRETGYEVERATGAGAFARVAELAANSTSFADDTVVGDTQYTYRVRAAGTAGFSDYSNTASATTPPSAAGDFAAGALSNTSVELTWIDQSTEETGFELERGDGCPGQDFTLLATLAPDTESYVDATALPETTYSYRLRATAAAGPSKFTPEACITTAPTDPTAQASTALDGSARLRWSDGSGVETGFEVQRGAGCPGQGFTPLVSLPPDTTQYSDPTALPETEYSYRIRAVSAGGASGWTDEICIGMPPFAPTGAVAVPLSASRVRITWNDNTTREAGYTLTRSVAGDDSFRPLADVGPNTTEYVDLSARQETAYEYRVAAYDENGRSTWDTTTADGTPAILVVRAATIRRPRGKRPAQLTLIGEFDAGEAPLTTEGGGTLTFGDGEIVIPAFEEVRKVLRYRADGVRLDLKRSRIGSSRMTFVLKVDGDLANAIEADGELACSFTQGTLLALGTVELTNDKYRPGGRLGRLVDPPLHMNVVSAGLRPGAKDSLRFTAWFDASGGPPGAAPDVVVRLGFYEFTAPGAQFRPKKKRWLFTQRGVGTKRVILDYGRGLATVILSKQEFGNYSPGAESVRVALDVGDLGFEDELVMAVRKTSMRY